MYIIFYSKLVKCLTFTALLLLLWFRIGLLIYSYMSLKIDIIAKQYSYKTAQENNIL